MDGLVDAYFSHLNHQPQLNNNHDLQVDEGEKVSELPACSGLSSSPRRDVSNVPSCSGLVIVTESSEVFIHGQVAEIIFMIMS